MSEDLLQDSWFVQEWMKKGEEQGLKKGLEKGEEKGLEQGLKKGLEKGIIQSHRHMVLVVIKARFPDLMQRASKLVMSVKEPTTLEDIADKISKARDEQEAAQVLEEFALQTKEGKQG